MQNGFSRFPTEQELKTEQELNSNMTNETIFTTLRELEEELHRARRNSDQARVGALIHTDFFEFGRSGRSYNRAEALDSLANLDENFVTTADHYKLRELAENLYLLSYRACQQMRPEPERFFSNRTSIWKFDDGRWQMFYHQGTPTEEAK